MFKKKPEIKTLSPLRSSDRRRTADRIIEEFKLDLKQASDESPEEKTAAVEARTALRNSLLPDNALSAKFTTTSGPNLKQVSGVMYVGSHGAGDQRILWFSIDDTIYPTVYSLWRNPGLVPLLHTPTVVIEKIQNGSDLMIPGLAGPPFPSGATKGAIVGVADYYNPSVPLTIGICEVDVSSLKQTQGAKGHAVNSVHWYGDEIWNWSTSGRSGLPAPEALQGWLQSESTISQSVNNLSLEDDDEEQDGDGGGVALSAPEPSTSHVKKEDIAEVVDMPEEDEMSTKGMQNYMT
jgi:translation initiation factor 2D